MMRRTGEAALGVLTISELPFHPWTTYFFWTRTWEKNKHLFYLSSWICVSLCWNSLAYVITNIRSIWPSSFKKKTGSSLKKKKFNFVFFLWQCITALNFVKSQNLGKYKSTCSIHHQKIEINVIFKSWTKIVLFRNRKTQRDEFITF